MSIKHIYWFAYFDASEPSVRYRAKYPLQLLHQQNQITYDLVEPGYRLSIIFRFAKCYLEVLLNRKRDSVIVFEKIRTRRSYAALLKLLLKIHPDRTVYDIDDADYLKFPPQTIEYFAKNCSLCTVGSHTLAAFMKKYNRSVEIVTSPVVSHKYIKQQRNAVFTVGWIGYYNAHRESLLQLLFPAVAQLCFPVRLVLMGVTKPAHINEIEDYFAAFPLVTLTMPQNIDWHNEENVYQQVSTFDVGVAPLLDTEVNRAKSAFKLKQYLSCGVPALASATGENERFLHQGTNGFICNTVAEYTDRITQFAAMSGAEYAALSENARNSSSSFSMQLFCDRLLSCFEDVVACDTSALPV